MHRWDCPTEYEARRKARDDAYYDHEYGRGNEYRRGSYECDEANSAYRREYEREAYYREEQAAEERRMARRRQERLEQEAAEQAYWEAEYQRQAEEQALQAEAEWFYWATFEAVSIYHGATT